MMHCVRAADESLASLKKSKPSCKHNLTFQKLFERFLFHRNQGRRISFQWIVYQGSLIAREFDQPKFTKFAAQVFIKRYQLAIHRKQRNKQASKTELEPKIRKWHCDYREGLIKSRPESPHYDPVWGRFALPPPPCSPFPCTAKHLQPAAAAALMVGVV